MEVTVMLEYTDPEDRDWRPDGTAPVEVPPPASARDPVLPGDTAVPAGTGVALLLGLVALSGSVVALGVVVTVVAVAWLVHGEDVTVRNTRGASPPPFGSPGRWP